MKVILGVECPFCEGIKRAGETFCDSCYRKIPVNIQNRLKNGLLSLRNAIFDAIKFLEEGK